MKKIDMVAIGTIAMVACLLFCTPALANYNSNGFPVVTRASGTVNGGVFIDSVPWADATTLTGNFNVPTGDITGAYLYTGIWGARPEYEGWVNVTFNGDYNSNGLGPIHLRGQNDTNANVWCSGSGKYWMYYDVTDLVNAGAVNTATTTKINETAGDFDGRVYGIVLVVVYEGGDDPKDIRYWINDGSDGLNDQHNAGTTDFAGSVAGSVTDAELTMVHLTAYEPSCNDCLQFNDNVLDTSSVDSNTFELNSWDVAGHVETSGNLADASYSRGDDGYVNVCNAILTLVSEELPDLVVERSVEVGSDGKFIVSYTVTNIGDGSAGESTMCKYVDGVLQETQTCPALAPDESHSGAFDSEDCPCGETLNVTVCADNEKVVDESDETNNCEMNFVDCPPCKPDLVVEKSVTIENGNFTVNYTVTNIGIGTANESSTCKYVDGERKETQTCPVLGLGESHNGTFVPESCPCGATLNVTICADNEKVVDESDETNNCEVNFVDCPPCSKPDLVVTEVNAYHYDTGTPAWFNLLNKIDVTVKNNGSASAGVSNVSLYIDDVFFGKLPVPCLDAGAEHTETFTSWKTIGVDCLLPTCVFDWSYQNYTLKGVADCDGDVAEWNETNNEATVVEKVCYNGYMADEPLENVAQGTLHGHVLFTTGDGSYGCVDNPDDSRATNYDLTLPASATVEHAQLNVYYTWVSPDHACPEMEVSITNVTGTYVVPLEKAYNDIKCTCPEATYVKSWGNYVFDITDYVTGTGAYTVTVKNVGPSGHIFCLAAPGIVLVYADESAPLIDYWVNKGADLLLGGRDSDGGYLSLGECINNATFPASTTTGEVATATLGVVAPWGDNTADDMLYFNDVVVGTGVYNGYSNPHDETIDSITMSVGASNAQVGVDVTDVTAHYLKGSANVAGQGDNGDNMMPANAFLVVAYEEEVKVDPTPDLNVTEITLNCGYLFAKEGNEICAKIENIGGGDAGAFNVSFDVDGFSAEVRIPGLPAGENTTVCINDTTIRNAGVSLTITVTADCDGEVSESDETNNVLTQDTTVVNNGYKGKRYTGGEDINTWDTFELHGKLIYSHGDSYYLSSYSHPDWTEYNVGWTTGDLPIPGTATIVTARLFVPYTWDKVGVMPASVSMSFNGNPQTLDAHYSDEKSWATSYPYGMLVYDVTTDFNTLGNVANLTNSHPGGGNVSMRGMLLVVVYAEGSEPERKILMNEEFDLLYGGAAQCTTPEEATAYAPFGTTIDTTEVAKATLITVAPGAGPDEGELGFNTHMWYNVWNFVGSTQIGIAETDVTAYLQADNNEAYFRSSADYMEASNAFLILEKGPKPDLNVTEITLNCGYLFAKEGNEICAKIENIGGGDAGAFNVSFDVDGFSAEVRIPGLPAGENTTVCINDTTIRNAGVSLTITVTADCDGEVSESDETNNVLTQDTTVVNNGYKGKRYTGGEDINTWDTFELHGKLIYSHGDSYYLSSYSHPDWTEYNVGWTTGDLPIPGTATIVTARLFVPYTWDKVGVMPASVSMSFNGNPQTLDAHYSDEKSWATSYPYGMLVYDVTTDFNTLGNVANLTNSHPGGGNVSMRGMLLVVVYAEGSEPERKILMNEEFDLLYGGAAQCTTPEEATAYAPFGTTIDTTEVAKATLITVAPGAGPDEGELGFNTHMWYNVWNFVGSTQIGIAETDVTAYLQADNNEAYFRSSADYMEASNAFLILEKGPKPDLNVTEITLNCGYLFAKEGNEICAKIENIGGGDAGAFNVSFDVDGFSAEVRIPGLPAGENTTVCINDTTIRNAGVSLTITVTADCDGEVSESDETNNVLTQDTTVVNNGYKGKRYTGGEDINTWDTFELHGKLIYSHGDSYYLSSYSHPDWTEYNVGWTTGDLPIPGTATIVTARLFVPYTWDKVGVMPASVSMSFNGNPQTLDAHYSDEKSWATSYPYGMLVYDVTTDFNTLGNVANLTNSHPGGGNVSMRGMLLVVVYAEGSEPERKILMNEEFDLLYGGAAQCTTPEEATAYAPFGTTIDTTEVAKATLITVAPGAGPDEGELGFNTHMWYNVWNFVGSTQIGIAETDVTAYLQADNNEAYFRSSADYMEASNAFLILEKGPKPDLNVTEITLNCGYLFAKEGNEICAKIENIGGGDAGAFNVSFDVDGFSAEVRIPGLPAGENTTVCINDTTIRNAGVSLTITVTADCDGEVSESDETNNVLTQDTTVVNNGYKGKRYTGGEDINTWDTFELHGKLIYSHGDSYYLSSYSHPDWTEYNVGWTTGDLPIPGTATIVTARLFVPYTWDKVGVMPASVSMSFNGNPQTLDAHYSDEKSWATSYPYGMLVYDVTTDFNTLGNVANLTNSHPGGGNVSMRGMLLVVVYAEGSEPERKILMNEEFDLLYGGAAQCTTPEEATAYAPFGTTIDTTEVAKATLITVAPGAGPDEGELGFNTHMWYNVWNFVGSTQIGIAETDVTAYLQADNNEAYFRSSADYMEASNAFLILEKGPKPDLNVTEITLNCGYLFAKEGNEICAKIENIGGGDAGAFNVSFSVDGFSAEVRILGLPAGENTTVCINDTTIRNAGVSLTITVTADCDGEVSESDETNNVLTQDTTVVNNGYKGKRYTGGEDINTWDTFELHGKLIYSHGDSYYLSSYSHPDWTEYNVGWTTGDLPIPGTATIVTARLFVPYTWDKVGVMPASVSMSFNGNPQTLDAHYSDEKSWATSYPYGMLVYDVTTDFNTLGNVANLTNSHPGGGNVSMRGMLLVVVYAEGSEPERKILMNEEFDLLYGGAAQCTTPEEATAYAPFGTTIDTTEVAKATLITVAPGAGPDEGELGFNTHMWYNVWNFVGSTQIGIAETDVTAYLQADNNEAYFRSSADYMEASNAFLILEKKEVPCPAKYAVYQANVIDPEKPLNKLRALRDNKLDDRYVTRYYDYSPALTMVLSRADPDLVKEGAQLLSRYSPPVGLHVQGLDVGTPITKRDVEEALSFTGRLKIEVMKNRDAIGDKSTEAIIVFIDEFEGQVKASEGKTFSAALKSSIYYEDERSRVYQEIAKK